MADLGFQIRPTVATPDWYENQAETLDRSAKAAERKEYAALEGVGSNPDASYWEAQKRDYRMAAQHLREVAGHLQAICERDEKRDQSPHLQLVDGLAKLSIQSTPSGQKVSLAPRLQRYNYWICFDGADKHGLPCGQVEAPDEDVAKDLAHEDASPMTRDCPWGTDWSVVVEPVGGWVA